MKTYVAYQRQPLDLILEKSAQWAITNHVELEAYAATQPLACIDQ